MKKLLVLSILILIFALTAFSASAVSFNLVKTEVFENENPQFQVILDNPSQVDKEFKISVVDFNWELDGDYNNVPVNAGSSKSVDVSLKKMSSSIKPGSYGVKVAVTDGDYILVERIIPITLLSLDNLVDVYFKGAVDPNTGNYLSLVVRNKRGISLDNLDIAVKGEFFSFDDTISLAGNEERVLSIGESKNAAAVEGENSAGVVVTWNGKKIFDSDVKFNVLKFENLKKVVEPKDGVFVFGKKLTLINEGNNVVSYPYVLKLGGFERMFTSFEPKPDSAKKTGDLYVLSWNVRVGPSQTKSVRYETNYFKPLLILIVIVVILWVVYSWRRHPLELNKRVLSLHTRDGRLFVVKVLLTLRNKTGGKIHDVAVRDSVPKVLGKPVGYGILKPSLAKSSDGGEVLVWRVGDIHPGEEKIISYKLEVKAGLVGSLNLSGAAGKYTMGGRRIGVMSSSVLVKEK